MKKLEETEPVHVFPTTVCNLRRSYCYVNAEQYGKEMDEKNCAFIIANYQYDEPAGSSRDITKYFT